MFAGHKNYYEKIYILKWIEYNKYFKIFENFLNRYEIFRSNYTVMSGWNFEKDSFISDLFQILNLMNINICNRWQVTKTVIDQNFKKSLIQRTRKFAQVVNFVFIKKFLFKFSVYNFFFKKLSKFA